MTHRTATVLTALSLVALMACGCAGVTTRLQTITDAETTTLTTRTVTMGTAKIAEAKPDAVYEFPDGAMRTGSASSQMESDVSVLVQALVEAVTAAATAQAGLGALKPLEALLPGLVPPG